MRNSSNARVQGDGDDCHYWRDVICSYLSSLKGSDGQPFSRLSKFAKFVSVLPHLKSVSNYKRKTPFCPNLSIDETLPSLLAVKLATEEPCHKYEPPARVIENAGKVTWQYNKECRNSNATPRKNNVTLVLTLLYSYFYLALDIKTVALNLLSLISTRNP